MAWISTNDKPRSGCPIEVTTQKIVEKMYKIVLTDRRVKMSETAEAIDVSTVCVHNILHEYVSINKLCVRQAPHLLAHK